MGANEEVKNDDGVAPRRLRLGPRHLQYAVPYSIGVSVLYLLGYWGAFQIDPFEYIGIGDVVKLAVYPLSTILVLGAAFVGAVQASGILLQNLFDTTKRWIRALLPNHPRLAALVYLTALLVVVAVLVIWSSYSVDTGTESTGKAHELRIWDLALIFSLWLSGSLAIRLGATPEMSAKTSSSSADSRPTVPGQPTHIYRQAAFLRCSESPRRGSVGAGETVQLPGRQSRATKSP